ncbi:MAG: hypothetical protein LC109_05935 [Bacteroidia bacterium]|nr:hypothetical protein [Bacteroidia bacterium]
MQNPGNHTNLKNHGSDNVMQPDVMLVGFDLDAEEVKGTWNTGSPQTSMEPGGFKNCIV